MYKRICSNKKLIFFIKFVFTFSILYYLVSKLNGSDIYEIISSVDPYYLSLAIIILLLELMLSTYRWFIVQNVHKIYLTFSRTLSYQWIGLFFNLTLPSSIGGDALKGYYLNSDGHSIRKCSSSIIIDRILGMIGLVSVIIITLPLFWYYIIDEVARYGVVFICVIAVSAIVTLLLFKYIPSVYKRFSVVKGVDYLSENSRSIIVSKSGLFTILLSMVLHLLLVLSVFLLSIAINSDISFVSLLVIMPVTNLIIAIPFSIAGWGVREGSMIIGLGYFSINSEVAMALSILYGLVTIVISLPGFLYWILNNNSR